MTILSNYTPFFQGFNRDNLISDIIALKIHCLVVFRFCIQTTMFVISSSIVLPILLIVLPQNVKGLFCNKYLLISLYLIQLIFAIYCCIGSRRPIKKGKKYNEVLRSFTTITGY